MASTRDVWYVVVISQEEKATSADKVKIPLNSDLADFRDAVHAKNSPILPGIVPIQLDVYANQAALDAKNPLGLDDNFEKYGKLWTDPLLVVVPTNDLVSGHDAPTAGFPPSKKQRITISTKQFEAFRNATLVDNCIITAPGMIVPYPNDELEKIFVRKCYEDVFALFMSSVENGVKAFGISGTPGIGKSLFFVYILYRLVHVQSSQSTFKPKRILYQTAQVFKLFDLEEYSVFEVERFGITNLVEDPETFYIIDGKDSVPVPSLCVVLFIASPRSEDYQEFEKQKKAQEWFLPVWTLNELNDCRLRCYPHLVEATLDHRYRIFGGVARPVFHLDEDKMLGRMEAALADVNAVQSVRNIGNPTRIFPTAHMLLHIIVSDDGNYKFKHVDIASKYVGEQLWQKHSAQMVLNLQEMFGGSPNEISRHLFEIYGHLVFSQGGKTLKCRNLDDGSISNLLLDGFNGKRESFTRNSIPTKPIVHYYEPTDDDTFSAIDSLSPQGMFQFTVGTEHPIRGVQILKEHARVENGT